MKRPSLIDDQLISTDEHYLCKYGFVILNRTQDRAWTGSRNIFMNTINLRLSSEKFQWDLKEVKQRLEIEKIQFTHLTGVIENKEDPFNDVEIKTKRKMFSFFGDKNTIENFYSIKQGEQILKKNKGLRQILLEFRDKDLEIKTTGGNLKFSFYFNSYFTDKYYDFIYSLLSEVVRKV